MANETEQRIASIWNIATDYKMNQTVEQQYGFALPPDSLRDKDFDGKTIEEVYQILKDRSCICAICRKQLPDRDDEWHEAFAQLLGICEGVEVVCNECSDKEILNG